MSDERHVIPRVEEELTVDKRSRQTGRVRIRKSATQREVPIETTLLEEGYEVERVERNARVSSPPQPRREGNTVVYPVIEERLVKQLVLVEEIRITPRRRRRPFEQKVSLRSEEVEISRFEPELRKESE